MDTMEMIPYNEIECLMLDRDNRTAKLPFLTSPVIVPRNSRTDSCINTPDWTVPKQNISHHMPRSLPGRTSPHSSSKTRKNRNSWKSLHSSTFLIVVAFSLFFNNRIITSISAAPLSNPVVEMERWQSTPKWVNPCGYPDPMNEVQHETDGMPVLSDDSFLVMIVNQAKIALNRAQDLAQHYVHEIFNPSSLEDFHASRKNWHYKWLPTKDKIPKELNETTPTEHINSLTMEQALLDAYEYLQTIAAGLEQIVWDQIDFNGRFVEAFEQREAELKIVLCEIQAFLRERGTPMRPDVPREVMPKSDRELKTDTDRDSRNWIILRDYINTLQYIHDVIPEFVTDSRIREELKRD